MKIIKTCKYKLVNEKWKAVFEADCIDSDGRYEIDGKCGVVNLKTGKILQKPFAEKIKELKEKQLRKISDFWEEERHRDVKNLFCLLINDIQSELIEVVCDELSKQVLYCHETDSADCFCLVVPIDKIKEIKE